MAVKLLDKGTQLEITEGFDYIVSNNEELRKLERDFVVITKEEGKGNEPV